MRFISILTFDRNANPHEDPQTPARMEELVAELRADGTLIDTGGRDSDMLELAITRKNGRTTVTDGPFAESKEVVGGYALLEFKDRDVAIAVTNRFLEALGADATCYLHEVSPVPELSSQRA
jgi:hypothetical protein